MKEATGSVTRRTFFTAGGVGALAALAATRLVAAQGQPSVTGLFVSADVEKANVRVVNDFCASLVKNDVVKATSLIADNCAYRVSQARPPVVGRDAVMERVKSYMDRGADFKVLKTVVLGPIVLNERDDIFAKGTPGAPGAAGNPGPRTIRIAAGLFFVENGKIVEWTDYIIR